MNHNPRPLDTLIQEFNRASELDRVSLLVTGKVHWFEVDGVPTRLVDSWLTELSPEERKAFEAHISQVVDETAKALGYENAQEAARDAGQKISEGIALGIKVNAPSHKQKQQ